MSHFIYATHFNALARLTTDHKIRGFLCETVSILGVDNEAATWK